MEKSPVDLLNDQMEDDSPPIQVMRAAAKPARDVSHLEQRNPPPPPPQPTAKDRLSKVLMIAGGFGMALGSLMLLKIYFWDNHGKLPVAENAGLALEASSAM